MESAARTSVDEAAPPTDEAPPVDDAARVKPAVPSCGACARGDAAGGPYFGPATAGAVHAQLLIVSAVVAVLSVAGDAHGGATKEGLPAAQQRWLTDCATMGISATSANVGLGITSLALTVGGALAGLRAAGAAPRLARGRARSEAAAAALRSLSGGALLLLGGALLAACVGVYAGALGRWLPSLRACAACRRQQLAWLATPRVSATGRDCPLPGHLEAAPAGMQTIAGLLGAGGLLCVARLGALVAAAERSERYPASAEHNKAPDSEEAL